MSELFKAPDHVEPNLDLVKQKFTREDGTVDVDALVKKAAHADVHIATLESESADLRTKLGQAATYEKLIQEINKPRPPQVGFEDIIDRTSVTSQKATEIDLDSMVETKINQKQQKLQAEANVRYLAGELQKLWGENYPAHLKQRAREVHLSEDYLAELAANNPRAFMAIVVPPAAPTVQNSFVPPTSTLRTSSSAPRKDYRYYAEQMKKDPKLRSDVGFNEEMFKAAKAMGADFYN